MSENKFELQVAEFGYHVRCPNCGNDDQQSITGICRGNDPIVEAIMKSTRNPSANDHRCVRQKALDKMVALRVDANEIVESFDDDNNFIHNIIHCMACNRMYKFGNLVSKIAYTSMIPLKKEIEAQNQVVLK